MNYYKLEKEKIDTIVREEWENAKDVIAIFTTTEWLQESKLRTQYALYETQDNIHFCKLEIHNDYMYGTIHIPIPKEHRNHIGFSFYILERKVIFIDNSGWVKKTMEKILDSKLRKGRTLDFFLYDFLICLIDEDLDYLEKIESEIEELEEIVLDGSTIEFNNRMLVIKKEIARLYRYYMQLSELGTRFVEHDWKCFEQDNSVAFRIFTDRAIRLQGETIVLRDYAMQVQEVYQSEIGIRQNTVMKVLTVVTTVFLPLTLIVGWYGMNFTNMPELQSPYGYPIVIGVCVVIVLFCLWLFRRKKYL